MGSTVSGGLHTWINRSDHPLTLITQTGRTVYAFNGGVVPAKTTTGHEVIFPCYELFRAFFGRTTDLAQHLLSSTWDRTHEKLIVGGSEHIADDGSRLWHLDLADGVPPSAVPDLAWLYFDKTARAAANSIYPASVRQGPFSQAAWIHAVPPITDQVFRIYADARPLRSRNALLVTRIHEVEIPIKVSALSYSVPVENVPVGQPSDPVAPEPTRTSGPARPRSVAPPVDARPTKRYLSLPSMAVNLIGFPTPVRSARSQRYVPIMDSKPSEEPPVEIPVSVGTPTGGGRRPRAQYSLDDVQLVKDRFKALSDLLEALCAKKVIQAVKSLPLVRPSPPNNPTYCTFPEATAAGYCRWSLIGPSPGRPRCAWVLELSVGSRKIYWIETEASDPRRGNHSLALEMLDGGSLDEGTLDALLDYCADEAGVWRLPIPFGGSRFVTALGRHTPLAGGLSPTLVLNAVARLAFKKQQIAGGQIPAETSAP
jgi:hypothetical protein